MRHTIHNDLAKARTESAFSCLQNFLPVTQEERMLRLHERLNQAWPTFGISGNYTDYPIKITEHTPGTCVRFFAQDGLTFHPEGVFRQGSVWCWSTKRNGLYVYQTNEQLLAFLKNNDLNWVVVI